MIATPGKSGETRASTGPNQSKSGNSDWLAGHYQDNGSRKVIHKRPAARCANVSSAGPVAASTGYNDNGSDSLMFQAGGPALEANGVGRWTRTNNSNPMVRFPPLRQPYRPEARCELIKK